MQSVGINLQQYFNVGYQALPQIDKKNHREFLNLSSNESLHSRYHEIFLEFIQNYDHKLITKYPVFREAHDFAASYHDVSQDQLILVPGSDFAINLIMNAIGKNMNGLVTHEPNYAGYKHYAALQNMPIHLMARIDSQQLLDFNNRLVVISNPEGFFGSTLPLFEVVQIAEICQAQGHILLIDEAYVEFNSFEHKSLLGKFENLIIVRSYSKGMGFASMRLGVVLANEVIITYLRRFASENCISDIALSFFIYLMQQKNVVQEINEATCNLRDYFEKALAKAMPQWVIAHSSANFVAISTRSEAEACSIVSALAEQKIRIRHLTEADHCKHYIRITVPPESEVDRLFDMLKQKYDSFFRLRE